MRCPRVAPENPRDRRLIDFPAAVRALPKAELHVHLDGSPRAQTLLDLAWAAKREPIADSPDGLVAALRAGNVFQSLEHYIAAFVQTISLMQTAPALRRIAHELMEDAAREAIHHLEVRFCPDLHTREGLSRDQVLEAVVAGLEEGKRKWELSYGVIVSGLREQGPEASLEMAQLAVAWRDRGVVAFDLAGPETGFPAREHEEAIRLARSAGLHLTLHAGEVTDAEAVREAVDLGTERIGHGVHLRDDPALLERLVSEQVPLEMCPSSNVQTQAVDGYSDHPALAFHRAGVAVTLNTDSRLISLTTVTDEFVHLRTHHGMTWEEALELCRNSFRYAFVSDERRDELVARVDAVAAKIVAAGFDPHD